MTHKYPYEWTLKDANFTKDKGTVFSCFSCGGGSTMGYKLAGFNVIGCNEIDPKMMEVYKANHNPKYSFLEGIQEFADREEYPEELYNLDILDGSPPCSSFSMAGNREKDWGKEKVFREGQAEQVLDTLFFDFIKLAKKLQPKVVIAENVKGLLQGDAQVYVNDILLAFSDAGYYADFELLNASKMGVPQKRERVFFYAVRKDIYLGQFLDLFQTRPEISVFHQGNIINFSQVKEITNREPLADADKVHWHNAGKTGRATVNGGNTFGFFYKAMNNLPCATITGGGTRYSIEEKPELLTDSELVKIGAFPEDYNFNGEKVQYIIGMSVPPLMTAHVADAVYDQWLVPNLFVEPTKKAVQAGIDFTCDQRGH